MSSLPGKISGRLGHTFPTNRGAQIKTVDGWIRLHREQAYVADPGGIGGCMPMTASGGAETELLFDYHHGAGSIRSFKTLSTEK